MSAGCALTLGEENTFCIDDGDGTLFARKLLRDDALAIAQREANRTQKPWLVYDNVNALDHEHVLPIEEVG